MARRGTPAHECARVDADISAVWRECVADGCSADAWEHAALRDSCLRYVRVFI